MYPKKRPRIEWTHYIGPAPTSASDDSPIGALGLDPLTAKPLHSAGIETVAQVRELLLSVEKPGAKPPKGIGKRRLAEIRKALGPRPTLVIGEPSFDLSVLDLIFAAFEAVARRCGNGALYHHGELVEHGGRFALRLRWSAGSNWQALVRALRIADKHFHRCPLRTGSKSNPITKIMDD